jgi:hypothetical protein|tara:strand:- start:901 stop:1167 length:267 start_codon:yes stop_codon:yes gene_type:complete
MCVFGGRQRATPLPTPQAFQPRVQQQKQEAVRPEKKELLDPDTTAEVSYGSGQKKSGPAAGKKTGTDALKINVNTGGDAGAGSGGLNV